MATINDSPHHGFHQVLAGVPLSWRRLVPHDINFLRTENGRNLAAFAIYSPEGGTFYYHDEESLNGYGAIGGVIQPKVIELLAGATMPGCFFKIMATNTTVSRFWAAWTQ